ncbi:hypothetical protein [Glutamicibacter halophytocola]|uniref:hypothetical protein n=1 Tax=Glutamicibacter halophytocola TaxID=1933880 RepID=UPI0015C56C58|nr:hypothetical protein [Glutamicibacter halophytocola]NQD40526.1 hypothetical protein [Glutamicibacter halophytocola]
MSWLKQSDVSANHPLVLRVLEVHWVDDRLLNEVYGWVNRCATQSAAFDRDYIVEVGTAMQLAGISRYKELLKTAAYCGIFEEKEIEEKGSKRPVLKLVEEADLFHMILKSEKEREKNRQADNRKPERSGPVRKRDGDECRWCGVIVRFGNGAGGDQKSARVGTIDHLDPRDLDDDEPTPFERLVVACKQCNSSRKDGATWDRPLRPIPADPYYSRATADWLLDKCGCRVKVSEQRRELFDPAPAPAFEGSTASMPEWARQASDDATANSGASSFDSNATADGTVERPRATDTPASELPRSHSDLLAFPAVHDQDETVETPASGETPAAAEQATDNSGQPAQHSRKRARPDQSQIKKRSTDHQTPINEDEGGGSGCAGSGRDGQGRAGKLDTPTNEFPEPPSNLKPRSRRRRPRRRKS